MTVCGCETEHEVTDVQGSESADGMVGFYVSVRDHQRFGFLLGPYETHAEALALVPVGRRLAQESDPRAAFYSFGTAKVTGQVLRPGVLNELERTEREAAK